jgi:hypothetical protein
VHPQGTAGTLRPFGVTVDVTLGPALATSPRDDGATPGPLEPHGPVLPLSLTIGAWLLGEQGPSQRCPVEGVEVAPDADPAACAALGAALAARADRVALLLMADGGARRGPQAPGYADPRAVPADDALVAALAAADVDALAALDPVLAADLLVQGRAALQVLAGAAGGAPWQGRVLATQDPYGVLYVVATWTGR